MNSFSFDLKREAALIDVDGDEAISELSAIIRTCGEITRNINGTMLVICTEIMDAAKRVAHIVKNIYGKDVEIKNAETLSFSKQERLEILVPAEITKQVLLDTEVARFDEDKYLTFNDGISSYLVTEEEQAKAFLRGAFIGAFSCNINLAGENNLKHSTGYHAEFVFSKEVFAQDFCFLLADFDIISKMMARGNTFVVYVKGLEMVSDLLALVGANKGVLALQNESAYRSIRNTVNRQNNCMTGNLTKTVDASVKQIEAINLINKLLGLETLPEPLQQAAFLRLGNPEESLEELVSLSPNPISKSGLYHRLKKLEKMAEELK